MSKGNHNSGGFLANLTPKQSQAFKVLVACAAALLFTIVAVVVVLRLTGGGSSDSYDAGKFELNTESSAILSQTDDAGNDYLADTVFVGDSNTVRMYNYGLLTLDQFTAKEGIGIQAVVSEAFVNFVDDANSYTIPQALSKMKPRRIVVMLGTNNAEGSMDADSFITDYRQALNAINSAYSYCDIIVASVPPVPKDHSNYPKMQMQTIDEFNQKLLELCDSDDYKFLNLSEVLKDDDGYGKADYFASSDIHFTTDGINAVLDYVRTHAYDTEDRRPDTDGDARAASATGSASEAGPTPTATPEVFTAKYSVEGEGGTLSCVKDNSEKKTSLTYEVTAGDGITVTAVPDEGYAFSKWSDGISTASRTDAGFRKDVTVSAVFTKQDVAISITPASKTVEISEEVQMTASVTVGGADYSTANVEWFDNNNKVGTGSSYLFETATGGTTHTIQATITVNGVTQTATATITVNAAATPTPSPSPTPTAEPTPTPTAEPTPEPAPEATPELEPENEGNEGNEGE